MKFRKRPIIIEAFQLGFDSIPDWFEGELFGSEYGIMSAKIATLEGVMTANRGDYIIKGIHGEIYPCKEDIFIESYEHISN